MAYFGDYHTHSIYSHGTGTIEDNVKAAVEKGLKEIAITDHGLKHLMYNVRRKDFPKAINDTKAVRIKYPQIKIDLGLETNFNSADGDIDLRDEDLPNLDLIICGYHKFVMPYHFGDFFTFFMPNFVLDSLRLSTKRQKNRNTNAYLKALERFDIDIISHINYGIAVDAVEVAKACAHYGTKIELNGKRINLTDKEIEGVVETGVELICNSDAHSPERVGDFSRGDEVISRLGIPYSQVCNWERFPVFRSRKNLDKA